MTIEDFLKNAKKSPGQFSENMDLSRYSSWRVGGPGEYVYQPKNSDDLISFLKIIPASLPITWLGLGSNTLIREGGIRGLVIITQGGLSELSMLDAQRVRIECGVACAQVARFCARQGLSGCEFLAGVPGTMGGALAMNAGCFGAETWEFVESVKMTNRRGEIITKSASAFQVQYRHVERLPDEWFLECVLRLHIGDKENALGKIRTLLDRRAATQPTSDHSCGSVFRNPPSDYSGRLIEACGLKGFTLGGAQVSEKHANFIINTGSATSDDIENLIKHVANSVHSRFNIDLCPEVKIIGDRIAKACEK